MKLTKLETKTGAAKGAFLHLKHPALGHKLYTGEGADDLGRLLDKDTATPVGVHVMGPESERVREQMKAINSKKMKGDDETDEIGIAYLCALITGFSGLEGEDGKPLTSSDADKRAFLEQSDGLAEQIMEFALDRGNFFAVA